MSHHKKHLSLTQEVTLLGLIAFVVAFITGMVLFLDDDPRAVVRAVNADRAISQSDKGPAVLGIKKVNGTMILYEGNSMAEIPSSGMTLPDGTRVEKDGSVRKADGKKVVLQNGQKYEIENNSN